MTATLRSLRCRLLAVAAVVLVCLPATSATAATPATPSRAPAPTGDQTGDQIGERLIVTLAEPTARTTVLAAVEALPAVRARPLGPRALRLDVARQDRAALADRLAAVPGVVAVEPDRYVQLASVPDDPRYPEQWAHQATVAEAAWDVTTGSPDVRVAVIDSGIVGDHPDIAPNLVAEQVVVLDGAVEARGTNVDNDDCDAGHGTLVAGVLGAAGDNGLGVTGVAWEVSLLDIAVLSQDTSCRVAAYSDIAAGIAHATHGPDGPVDVINLSLGGPADSCPTALQVAVEEARAEGIVVVAAAGNDQRSLPGQAQIPASCDGVISVAGTGRSGEVADYSTRNSYVDLAAPGGEFTEDGEDGLVLTTAAGGGIDATEGTSFSAPYAAGVAALVRAAAPELDADAIEAVLEQTATDIGVQGRDDATGWGLVQAGPAVERAVAADAEGLDPATDPGFPVGVTVTRLAADEAEATEAVAQAATVSRAVFGSGTALHAVLARADDYADALAGSGLGYGVGPLLFTPSTGELADETRRELLRVLPEGSTVYLLGGAAALPAALEGELRALGFVPVRLAGPTREETAVAVAREIAALELPALDGVLLATRGDWPDAVTGGSIAAYFGLPILLTPAEALHPATAAALGELSPERLFVLGGEAAVGADVMDEAGRAGGTPVERRVRLGGAARDETAIAVARQMEALLAESGGGEPSLIIAVNVDREDGFAHVLSASALAGASRGVFVPVRGTDGDVLPDVAVDYVRARGLDGTVIGGQDLVAERVAERLAELLGEG